jgi:hypothetical protein
VIGGEACFGEAGGEELLADEVGDGLLGAAGAVEGEEIEEEVEALGVVHGGVR